ncbi:hypothetical protein LB535_24825 [Mesorhizobium sp. CA10]|uniref:hypothetical protein n=1 Tax=Mesorhizobium sp. CA10 TaxID=588495 RepID=UPI001CCFFC32|nr:hypothetical protein [Mesorhizobium sp. CA10]MBZ9885567.1 hypothetical protein [Mesorhizobium sp. CA10]
MDLELKQSLIVPKCIRFFVSEGRETWVSDDRRVERTDRNLSAGRVRCCTVAKSVALALLDDGFAGEGTELSIHIVGVERPARVIAASPCDAEGKAMRQ